MVDPATKCLHRAMAFGGSFVVNNLPLCAILLVGNLEHGCCCSQEVFQWGCIWDDGVMAPECDVFHPKLLGAALCGWIKVGIFPHPEQVEECHCDKVASCCGFGVGCQCAMFGTP